MVKGPLNFKIFNTLAHRRISNFEKFRKKRIISLDLVILLCFQTCNL